uniref:DPY30 domain-containing protein 1 n=1 Tax=Jaculus jaculus TaxID=51337 RepID=UPI0003331039|nr:DPY30 domain-containing protein 1 [Jaculus jaculus]
MESTYLRGCLGTCLTQGLAEVARTRPVDPVEYLALWIYKYKENEIIEKQRQEEMAKLEQERMLALMEQEISEQLRAEEMLFQQQQLAIQQEMERQKEEELQRAGQQSQREAAMYMDNTARDEDWLISEEERIESRKTLAEISDRYGAPNLSRVEELDEPMLSDVALNMDQDL